MRITFVMENSIKYPIWPIRPTFLSLSENSDEDSIDINNDGMFYPDYLQGFLGALANLDNINNPLTLCQFAPKQISFQNGNIIQEIDESLIDKQLVDNIISKKIIRIDSGKQFPIKECCRIFREESDICKNFCAKKDTRVAIFANPKLKNEFYSTSYENKLTEIVNEYNDYYKLPEEYKIYVRKINLDNPIKGIKNGSKSPYLYIKYQCAESQLIEYIFPITYSNNIIACLVQGQNVSADFVNNKYKAFASVSNHKSKKKIVKFLDKLIPEDDVMVDSRIGTIANRIFTFEKRIKAKVELSKQQYINWAFAEVYGIFNNGIKEIKNANLQEDSKNALEVMRKYADEALYKICNLFAPENIFIRIFAIDSSTSDEKYFLFAKSDQLDSTSLSHMCFNINFADINNFLKNENTDEICIEMEGELKENIIRSFSDKDKIHRNDVIRFLPTLSPKVSFIIWKRYDENFQKDLYIQDTFRRKLIDFYILLTEAYTTIIGIQNEKMLETSIRVAGHEAGNILPVAIKFVKKINVMPSMDLLHFIKNGNFAIKMEDLEVQLRLTKNIYDKPRLIFKKIVPQRTTFKLYDILQQMAALMRPNALVKSQLIPPPDESAKLIQIKADKDLLYHVFFNLLDNSIKYCYKGTYINFKFFEKKDKLIICLIGYGSEIGKEEPIYDLYYRGINQKDRNDGLGIGMYLSKRIIDGHEFYISHESVKISKDCISSISYQLFQKSKEEYLTYYNKHSEIVTIDHDRNPLYRPGPIEIEATKLLSTYKNTFYIEIPVEYYQINK